MALLSLKIPHEVARLLGQLPVPGDKSPVGEMHITLVYLGKDRPIDQVADAIKAVYEVTSRTKPFTVKTGLITSFPAGDDGFPIIAKIESPELFQLQAALRKALDGAGVEYDKKWPTYRPHATLAYLTGEEAPPDQPFSPIEWGVGELVLWGGDQGDERLSATFPFALTLSKAAMYRAFVRMARSKRAG